MFRLRPSTTADRRFALGYIYAALLGLRHESFRNVEGFRRAQQGSDRHFQGQYDL